MTSTSASLTSTERWITRILRAGLIVSATMMVIGLLLLSAQSGPLDLPAENPSLGDLLAGFLNSTGRDGQFSVALRFMYTGLVLLMFTPFLRVLTTVVIFVRERDWKYSAVAMTVLIMLIGEVLFAFR